MYVGLLKAEKNVEFEQNHTLLVVIWPPVLMRK